MGALVATGVRKEFGGHAALSEVELEVRAGEVHALLGGNGSGKSTLIKALAGVQHADTGRIVVGGDEFELAGWTATDAHANGLRFVHQAMPAFNSSSVAENLCAGHGWERRGPAIDWKRVRAKARRVLDELEIEVDVNSAMRDLTPAQRSVVAVARAFLDLPAGGTAVLVLDEPSAVLHDKEMHILTDLVRKVASQGHGVIYVSHRMDEVMGLADRLTVLRDGRNVGTASVAETSKSDLMHMILGHAHTNREAARSPLSGPTLLAAEDIRTATLQGVSCNMGRGEIVGVAGLADAGCSELLRALYGSVQASGRLTLHKESQVDLRRQTPRRARASGIGYVPSDRAADAVFGGLTLVDNASIGSLGHYYRGIMRGRRLAKDASRVLDAHGVRRASDQLRITALSGGNQQKVVMSRVLRRNPRVLLLDDPTQGIDVGAKDDLWTVVRRLTAAGTSVLVHSTDYEELVNVADRVIVLALGRQMGVLGGADLTRQALTELTYETERGAA